jgi:hypothetical protein
LDRVIDDLLQLLLLHFRCHRLSCQLLRCHHTRKGLVEFGDGGIEESWSPGVEAEVARNKGCAVATASDVGREREVAEQAEAHPAL